MKDQPKCGVCGEPMADGESMFKFHGYSGPCPKPPLPKPPNAMAQVPREPTPAMFIAGTKALAEANDSFARRVWQAMFDAATPPNCGQAASELQTDEPTG